MKINFLDPITLRPSVSTSLLLSHYNNYSINLEEIQVFEYCLCKINYRVISLLKATPDIKNIQEYTNEA